MFYLYFPTDEWLRPLLKQDKQVLVHWWYYPDRFVLSTLYKLKLISNSFYFIFIFIFLCLVDLFLKAYKSFSKKYSFNTSCTCTAVHAAGKTHSQVESLFSTG